MIVPGGIFCIALCSGVIGGLRHRKGVAWPVKGNVRGGGCIPGRIEVFFDKGLGCVRGLGVVEYNLGVVDVP